MDDFVVPEYDQATSCPVVYVGAVCVYTDIFICWWVFVKVAVEGKETFVKSGTDIVMGVKAVGN